MKFLKLQNIFLFLKIMKYTIKEWLAFNDNEIGLLQNFVTNYVVETDLDKIAACNIGILSSQIQYNMRLVKELTYANETKHISEIITFIAVIDSYKGFALFLKEKLIAYFNKLSPEKRFFYLQKDEYKTSYFGRSEKENASLIESNWRTIFRWIEKYL